jgi:hypothetical protein
MLVLLNRKGVSFLYSVKDIEEDLKTSEELQGVICRQFLALFL